MTKRKITLDMMKDEKIMISLTEDEQKEMAKLYVTNFVEKGHKLPSIICSNCGKNVEDVFKIRGKETKEGRKYFCSKYCFDGGSKKRLKKK